MKNEKTIGGLAKIVTGLENETLALATLEFCNQIYPLEIFKFIENEMNKLRGQWGIHNVDLTDKYVRKTIIDCDKFEYILNNEIDPDKSEIQQFCALMKDLEFKFSKFQNLIDAYILDCKVGGDKNGAYIVNLSFRTNKPEERNALFMKKFNPEDFNEESK